MSKKRGNAGAEIIRNNGGGRPTPRKGHRDGRPSPRGCDQDAKFIKDELSKADAAEAEANRCKAKLKAEEHCRKYLEHRRAAGKRLAKVRDECKRRDHPYYRKWFVWLNDNGIDEERAVDCIDLLEMRIYVGDILVGE